MEELGAQEGLTRSRVQQLLAPLLAAAGLTAQDVRRRLLAQAHSEAALAELLERCASARPCEVCGAWVLRGGKRVTCSPACAEVWRKAWWLVSEEEHQRHRLSVARSILRHPEGKKPSQLAWARQMLSDAPPPPNRRYVQPDSWAAAATRAVGLEPVRAVQSDEERAERKRVDARERYWRKKLQASDQGV